MERNNQGGNKHVPIICSLNSNSPLFPLLPGSDSLISTFSLTPNYSLPNSNRECPPFTFAASVPVDAGQYHTKCKAQENQCKL